MESEEVNVFVFYTLNRPEDWVWHDLPNNWRWAGAGSVSPCYNTRRWKGWFYQKLVNIFGSPNKYKREEQFNGPEETIEEVKQILNRKMQALRDSGIVKCYHIQNDYVPLPGVKWWLSCLT
jgi:hypothetical protein